MTAHNPSYVKLEAMAVDALDGMRASVRWDKRSPLHMNDKWLAKTVLDRIWPEIERMVGAAREVAYQEGYNNGVCDENGWEHP